MEFEFLVQPAMTTASSELDEVRSLARDLHRAMDTAATATALAEIPPIGGTSHAVDAIVTPIASHYGFLSQRADLFSGYPTRLRPDWYRPLGGSGILLEIERGKTITNNMDLLDLWKCHICREADHLFLVVPLRVTRTTGSENVYSRVVARMKTFVMPENQVNVASIAVFGY